MSAFVVWLHDRVIRTEGGTERWAQLTDELNRPPVPRAPVLASVPSQPSVDGDAAAEAFARFSAFSARPGG